MGPTQTVDPLQTVDPTLSRGEAVFVANIPLIAWVILGGIILAVTSMVWSSYARRRRIELMQAAADDLGLSFFVDGDPGLVNELGCFELFSQGRQRRISNMIYGDAGNVKVGIFDYRFTTGHGKHKHTSQQSVAYIHSAELKLPDFALRPENVFHKIGGALGFDDIDFESHPKFSGAYLLRGSNEEQIRAVFSADVLTQLESQSGISIEGSGQRLIYYQNRRMVAPGGMRGLMEEGFKVFGLFRDAVA